MPNWFSMNSTRIAWGGHFLEQVLNIFVIPEVQRRAAEGTVTIPVMLNKVQVLLYLDGRPSVVRLNDEVSAVAEIVYVGQRPLVNGAPIYEADVAGVNWVRPGPDIDPNCGHIFLLRIGTSYHCAFDFVYNKSHAIQIIAKAEQFLRAARTASENGDLSVAVDTLFSAAELTAKALLITNPFGSPLLEKATHGGIRSKFGLWAKWGNVEADHRDTFNTLARMRDAARYTRDPITSSIDVVKLIADVASLIRRVGKLVERPELPPLDENVDSL